MHKFRIDQFACVSVFLFVRNTHTGFYILFNLKHGGIDRIAKDLKNAIITTQDMKQGNRLWAMEINVVPNGFIALVSWVKLSPRLRINIVAKRMKHSAIRLKPRHAKHQSNLWLALQFLTGSCES